MKANKKVMAVRQAVFLSLQGDAEYERLFAAKDAALHTWNALDAWKNSRAAEPAKLAAAKRRVSSALGALQDYEDAALRAVGVSPAGLAKADALEDFDSTEPKRKKRKRKSLSPMLKRLVR